MLNDIIGDRFLLFIFNFENPMIYTTRLEDKALFDAFYEGLILALDCYVHDDQLSLTEVGRTMLVTSKIYSDEHKKLNSAHILKATYIEQLPEDKQNIVRLQIQIVKTMRIVDKIEHWTPDS